MTTQRSATKAKTRATILAVAETAFRRDGYEATTIRGIATEAGMSTGAVFNTWAGKAELYRDAFGHEPISPEQGRALYAALRETLGVLRSTPFRNGLSVAEAQAVVDAIARPQAKAA